MKMADVLSSMLEGLSLALVSSVDEQHKDGLGDTISASTSAENIKRGKMNALIKVYKCMK